MTRDIYYQGEVGYVDDDLCVEYCERGVLNYFNGLITWEELLSGCIFADTGEPAGVRV